MDLLFASFSWLSSVGWWLSTLVLLLFLCYYHYQYHHHYRYNLPPGPKPWPIIGNLNLIGSLPHKSLHALSQKYGPIMHLQFGSSHFVVGSSVQMAKAFLKTHDVSFASRPKTTPGKYLAYNYSNMSWAPYGPHWRQARRLCFIELFSPKSMGFYEYIRKEEVNILLNNLFNSSTTTILLRDYLNIFNLSIISRIVLGKKYVDKTQNACISPKEFKEMVEEFMFLNGCMNIGDSIPWIDFLDLQGFVKRMKIINKKFDKFLEHVLDEHDERRGEVKDDDYAPKDMVDVILKVANDPSLEVKIERHRVKALTQVSI